jgi:energy-coupling factor transporter ATP-binding protein EcfA2
MRVNNQIPNQHIYGAGTSGSGKSWRMEQILKKVNPDRLLIWDAKMEMPDNYLGGIKKINNINKLYEELATNKKGKYCFIPNSKDDYFAFCDLALAWANCDDGLTHVYIEEAGGVSNAGKSKEAEYNLITKGRAFGVVLYYISQGFAGSSGTAFQNIDNFIIGRQKPNSIKYIRENLNVELAEKVKNLEGYSYCVFNSKNNQIQYKEVKS